jgi:hypothetical protein
MGSIAPMGPSVLLPWRQHCSPAGRLLLKQASRQRSVRFRSADMPLGTFELYKAGGDFPNLEFWKNGVKVANPLKNEG